MLVAGLVAGLTLDLLPWNWAGTAVLMAVLALTGTTVARAARARSWGLPHVTALAAAGLVARCLIGFLAPMPPGVTAAAKYTQNVVLLLLVTAVALLAWQRARPAARPAVPHDTVPAEVS